MWLFLVGDKHAKCRFLHATLGRDNEPSASREEMTALVGEPQACRGGSMQSCAASCPWPVYWQRDPDAALRKVDSLRQDSAQLERERLDIGFACLVGQVEG